MLKVTSIIAAGAMLILATPLSAQHFNGSDVQQCDVIPGSGNSGVRACVQRLADTADAEREQLIGRIRAVIDGQDADRLRHSERLWLTYRDAFCDAEHGLFDGGTAGLSARPACRLSVTRHHLDDLELGFGWLIEKRGAVSTERVSPELADLIIDKLDLTSFRNSIGPRRISGLHSFADYGFADVTRSPSGAELTQADGGWMMGFQILSNDGDQIRVCFVDRGLRGPHDLQAPSYDARSALILRKTDTGQWPAAIVSGGFLGCTNNPPK